MKFLENKALYVIYSKYAQYPATHFHCPQYCASRVYEIREKESCEK